MPSPEIVSAGPLTAVPFSESVHETVNAALLVTLTTPVTCDVVYQPFAPVGCGSRSGGSPKLGGDRSWTTTSNVTDALFGEGAERVSNAVQVTEVVPTGNGAEKA